jgi:hypothetical protein
VREEVAEPAPTSNTTSPARPRKKRKQGAPATDEIDTLFDDAFGRKVARTALEEDPVHSLTMLERKKTKHGGARGSEGVEKNVDLAVVVDAIKAVPRGEGKKRGKWPGS